MSQDLNEKWNEIKVEIRKVWGDITGEELPGSGSRAESEFDSSKGTRSEKFNPIVIRQGSKTVDVAQFMQALQKPPQI